MKLLQPQTVYTPQEKAELIIAAIKANQDCAELRKNFNLCNAKIPNVYVNPEFCESDAKKLIDCFQSARRDIRKECEGKFEEAKRCLVDSDRCGVELDGYFNCDGGLD